MWLAAEGERVRDNAKALMEAASTAQNLVSAKTVHEYLGASWLEVHSVSRERAHELRALLDTAGH